MDIEKDFSRNVWCVLGLPFDTLTLVQAADAIVTAVASRTPYFMSTPNTNFLCAAHRDAAFRDSILNSDLSIVDGFPIVVVAKLLGIPMPERIGGSNLTEYLYNRKTDKPIKVFFLGGADGVGELASQKINRLPSGMVAVGHYTPGFGSLEEMSSPEVISTINQQDVDFLLISLGAKKGQAWIEKNRHLLKVTVIGYLGAVINFFAGTVQRAPGLIQTSGLEWLWRIYQEPSLWRRYFVDGMYFLGLMLRDVLPYWLWLTFKQPKTTSNLTVKVAKDADNHTHITLQGDCTSLTLLPLRKTFIQAAKDKRPVVIDLADAATIDSAFLGLCLVLHKHLKASGHNLKLINANKDVSRIMKWQKVDDLFC